MLEEKQLDIGLVELNYAEGPPSGPPLVLLHGGSARWQSFESIIPDLVPEWHLYAPDLRGHGKSGRVPKRYRLQDYADDIARFLEVCVRHPAILIGHSLGGMVSIMVAAQNQAYVQAVVAGDAPLSLDKKLRDEDHLVVWRDLAGGRYTIAEMTDKLRDVSTAPEWLATNLYYNDPDMLTALIEERDKVIAGYDMDVLLPSVQCPVLLLQADPGSGGVMTNADVEHAFTLLSKPTHVRLTGVGHALHHVWKEPVLAVIKSFLASIC